MAKLNAHAKWLETELKKMQASFFDMHEALAASMMDREGSHMTKVGQFTVDDWTVTAWIVNPLRAHGGLVLIRQAPSKGSALKQNPDFWVHSLETYYREICSGAKGTDNYICELRTLLEKAQREARQQQQQAHETAAGGFTKTFSGQFKEVTGIK